MSNSQTDQSKNEATVEERQVVALHLAEEIYGIDISLIHTVITPQTITAVPRSSASVKGVINLRGRIIPVIDMRARFGLAPLAEDKQRNSRFVIVEVGGLTAGLIVDAVSEVLRIPADRIDAPSQLVINTDMTDCVTGIGRIPVHRSRDEYAATGHEKKTQEERLIILLDVYKAITSNREDSLPLAA